MTRPYRREPNRIRNDSYRLDDQYVSVTARIAWPSIVVLDNFLSKEECRELIILSRPNLAPSLEYVPGDDIVRVANEKGRISETVFYGQFDEHPLIQRIETRISTLLGIPQSHGEGMSVTRYGPGGFVGLHRDYLELEGTPEDSPTRKGGYRMCTFLMFLNDVRKGGETHFFMPGLKFQPRAGRALYFEYCNSMGQIDDDTLHEGLPVGDGEKWIITKWYRQQAFQQVDRDVSESA
jgi:prolyl 4-hydroxylase